MVGTGSRDVDRSRPDAYVGRFAPSPTGPLHLGSLVAALASWLDARAAGGRWLVRIDDLDTPRCVPGAGDGILRDLEAHGLHWDGPVVRQDTRRDAYEAALAHLRAARHVFRCRCTRRHLRGHAIYPGTCRGGAVPASEPHTERLRVPPVCVAFTDREAGEVRQRLDTACGDFVLRRRDGLHAYQLAVVVDDADAGITDVVRGADLLDVTPRQILLQALLDLPTPRYRHVPVVAWPDGTKLSKQTGAPALAGAQPEANVRRALRHLGVPVAEGGALQETLDAAVAAWDALPLPDRVVP
jgi:glutamyl-Q tRNA(Asp) synthetase